MWGMLSTTATEMVSAQLKKKYVTHFQSAHLGVSTCKMYIYVICDKPCLNLVIWV